MALCFDGDGALHIFMDICMGLSICISLWGGEGQFISKLVSLLFCLSGHTVILVSQWFLHLFPTSLCGVLIFSFFFYIFLAVSPGPECPGRRPLVARNRGLCVPGALGGAAAACGAGAPWRSSGVESVGAGAAVWVWRWW